MPRKRSVREDAEASRPRQLRKRLRKAEDQLADAVLKRDRAQARVEALNIIADEIRAQLSEADKSAELEAGVRRDSRGGLILADFTEDELTEEELEALEAGRSGQPPTTRCWS